jgi:hypothetical protein
MSVTFATPVKEARVPGIAIVDGSIAGHARIVKIGGPTIVGNGSVTSGARAVEDRIPEVGVADATGTRRTRVIKGRAHRLMSQPIFPKC